MSYFEGTWYNVYNSRMVLNDYGDGLLGGSYSSTTGSSGSYHVIGFGSTDNPTQQNGVGVALTIYWLSYTGGQGDPSWHWVSGLGGQGLLDGNGNPTLSLNHALVATANFPGLASVGTYLDKLLYTTTPPAQAAHPEPVARSAFPRGVLAPLAADPVAGVWTCSQLPLTLTLNPPDATTGYLTGVVSVQGSTYDVVGFADVNAQTGGLSLEGLTVAGFVAGSYLSLSGWLDLGNQTLSLLQMNSNGTASTSTYVQTAAQGLNFYRS